MMNGTAARNTCRARAGMIQRLQEQGINDKRVLAAMNEIPREIFVDEVLALRAYEDCALPIGFGQTLSQPYIVARMTEVILRGGPVRKVLEVGTGSGYQAAVLSKVVREVFSIERISALQQQAKSRHRALGLLNVRYMHGDGYKGWKSQAPFDAILVTAAPENVPPALKEQLAIGGRMVLPLGPQNDAQRLIVITRSEEGFTTSVIGRVAFVPMLAGETQ
ncbi:MAG TPA: protein-L-isoaspartate(D-aspartate) O-methyltransferase [Halothiobacillus sp.]|nr:protein-L-isoaspartate(D-aspartate) O-methyltransferase [Halothiobacillus sp.]